MTIQWLGCNAFRIQHEGVTIITNPAEPAYDFKIHKQGADILLVTQSNDVAVSCVSGSPLVIHEPGEYEVKSVFVYGVNQNGKTMYLLQMEDVSIAFIGTIKVHELTDRELEILEGADILIVPVGGGPVCSSKDAVKIIAQVEPRLVIPSFYRTPFAKNLDPVELFLKEYSAPKEEHDKLKVHKKDLQKEDTRVIILTKQ